MLVLTSLDPSSNVIKQEKVLLPGNLRSGPSVGIAKTSAGYFVTLSNNSIAYLFDTDLKTTGFTKFEHYTINSIMSWNDNYYTTETSDQSSRVRKLDTTGSIVWDHGISSQTIYSCNLVGEGAYRNCRKVIKGLHDFVSLSYGVGASNSLDRSSIYIDRISMTGKIR